MRADKLKKLGRSTAQTSTQKRKYAKRGCRIW